jgi:hypothetical protein
MTCDCSIASSQALFETYSLAEGVDFANRQLATVLSSDEWMQLMKDLDFIDQEFTVCARAADDGH